MLERLRISLWRGSLGLGLIAIALGGLSDFRLSSRSIAMIAICAPVIWLFASREIATFGRSSRLASLLECWLLFTLISGLGAVLSYFAMAFSSGYADNLLAQLDRAMGFNWPSTFAFVQSHPLLEWTLTKSYFACFSMPFLVLGILFHRGDHERMYRYLLAHGVGLLATVIVFFFFPARAAFDFYLAPGFAMPANVVHYSTIIAGLRDGSLTTIPLENLGGIITFPSFHATMAVLFAWAIWPCGMLRGPLAIVNGLMWIAAVPIGGHYAVDLFGGTLIAFGAIVLANRLFRPTPYHAGLWRIGKSCRCLSFQGGHFVYDQDAMHQVIRSPGDNSQAQQGRG